MYYLVKKRVKLVTALLSIMVHNCKKNIFKQEEFMFTKKKKSMPRHFFLFKKIFINKKFYIYNGKRLFLKKLSANNFFNFKFGDFCPTKRRGSIIHGRNTLKRVEAKKKKDALLKIKKERRVQQEQVIQTKKVAITNKSK